MYYIKKSAISKTQESFETVISFQTNNQTGLNLAAPYITTVCSRLPHQISEQTLTLKYPAIL